MPKIEVASDGQQNHFEFRNIQATRTVSQLEILDVPDSIGMPREVKQKDTEQDDATPGGWAEKHKSIIMRVAAFAGSP